MDDNELFPDEDFGIPDLTLGSNALDDLQDLYQSLGYSHTPAGASADAAGASADAGGERVGAGGASGDASASPEFSGGGGVSLPHASLPSASALQHAQQHFYADPHAVLSSHAAHAEPLVGVGHAQSGEAAYASSARAPGPSFRARGAKRPLVVGPAGAQYRAAAPGELQLADGDAMYDQMLPSSAMDAAAHLQSASSSSLYNPASVMASGISQPFADHAAHAAGQADADGTGESSGKMKRRFLWTDLLHRRFVAAMFDFGVMNATPKTIFGLMQPGPPGMTTDHIKSHLQKFRMNTKISHDLFMQDYEQAREDAEARFAEHMKRSGSQAPPVQFSAYPVTLSSPQAATCATCRRYAALFELGVGVPEEGLPAHSHAAQLQPQLLQEQQTHLAQHEHAGPGAAGVPDAPASSVSAPPPPAPPAAVGAASGHLEAQLAHLQSQLNQLHQQTAGSSAGGVDETARVNTSSSSATLHGSTHGKDALPPSVSAALESAQAMRVELGETIGRFERETSRLFDEVLVGLKRDGPGSSAAASAAAAAATALGSSRTGCGVPGPSDAPLTYLGLLNSLAKPHAAEATLAGQKGLSGGAAGSAPSILEQFSAIQRQMGDQLRIEKAIRKRHEGQLSLHGASMADAPAPEADERLDVALTAAIETGGEAGLQAFFALRFSLDDVLLTQTASSLEDGQTISGVVSEAIAVDEADRDPSACLRFLLISS